MIAPVCPHCARRNLFGEAPVIATEADGDYTCRACGHHWRPRPTLASLATEPFLDTLTKEQK